MEKTILRKIPCIFLLAFVMVNLMGCPTVFYDVQNFNDVNKVHYSIKEYQDIKKFFVNNKINYSFLIVPLPKKALDEWRSMENQPPEEIQKWWERIIRDQNPSPPPESTPEAMPNFGDRDLERMSRDVNRSQGLIPNTVITNKINPDL